MLTSNIVFLGSDLELCLVDILQNVLIEVAGGELSFG